MKRVGRLEGAAMRSCRIAHQVICLVFVLVMAAGCAAPPARPTPTATSTPTQTPTPSPTPTPTPTPTGTTVILMGFMDMAGPWTGTEVDVNGIKYDLVVTIRQQYGSMVVAHFVGKAPDRYFMGRLLPGASYQGTRTGEISGNTIAWKWLAVGGDDPPITLQVSGNSMTGKGEHTDPSGVIHYWEYNLTR